MIRRRSFSLALMLAQLARMSHSSQCHDPDGSFKFNPDDVTNRPSRILLSLDVETKDHGLMDTIERTLASHGINLQHAIYFLILILVLVICIPICCCVACCGCCCCTIAGCFQGLCKCLTCCCPTLIVVSP